MKDMLVLLSTYNGETFLREQLDSILNQTISVDILIRDDGSSDQTLEILEEYANKYHNLKYFLGENVGVVHSYIALMRQAKEYAYYAFSDQDDIWLPNKLEIAHMKLATMNQQKPCLYCSCSLLVNNDMEGKQVTQINRRGITFYNVMIQNLMPGHAQVFNRALLDLVLQHQIDFQKVVVHDYWLAFLCVTFGNVYFDNTYHTYYRQHSDNAIGYGHGPKGWILERLKRVQNQAAKDITRQNQLFYNVFKDKIKNEYRKELALFLNSQKNILTRAGYLVKARVYRQKRFETLLFYILYLLGGYNIDK